MSQLFHLLKKQNNGSQMRSDLPRFTEKHIFLYIFIVTYCDLKKMYFVLSGTYFWMIKEAQLFFFKLKKERKEKRGRNWNEFSSELPKGLMAVMKGEAWWLDEALDQRVWLKMTRHPWRRGRSRGS